MRTRILCLAAATFAAASLVACAGQPDSTFGAAGIVLLPGTTGWGPSTNGTVSTVALRSGKIMATASGKVVRLNANGTVDTSYGNRGVVSASDLVLPVLESDGRVLGFDSVTKKLRLYNAAGAPETTFGGGSISVPNAVAYVPPALASTGEVYQAIWPNGTPSTYDKPALLALRRLTSSGQVDPTFAFRYMVDPDHAFVGFSVLGADNNVFITSHVTGSVNGTAHDYWTLEKLSRTGSLDKTFANAGTLRLPADVSVKSFATDGAGRLVVLVRFAVGKWSPALADHPWFFAFTPRGRADISFGWLGMLPTPVSEGTFAIDHSDRLVVADGVLDTVDVRRYLRDGQLDRLFGIRGVAAFSKIHGFQLFPWVGFVSVAIDAANRLLIGVATGDKGTSAGLPDAVIRLRAS